MKASLKSPQFIEGSQMEEETPVVKLIISDNRYWSAFEIVAQMISMVNNGSFSDQIFKTKLVAYCYLVLASFSAQATIVNNLLVF